MKKNKRLLQGLHLRVRFAMTIGIWGMFLQGLCFADTNVIKQENFYTTPGIYTGKPYYSSGSYRNAAIDAPANCNLTAANIKGVPPSAIVMDETKYGNGGGLPPTFIYPDEPAVNLSPGGASIPFSFQNLKPGVYAVRLVGRVNEPTVPRIRKPVYVHLSINDGPNGEINDYRMRVNYDNVLEEVGRIFFYALNSTNNLSATLYLGPGTQENLLIHRIDFYDGLAGTMRTGYKKASSTFTPSELAYQRQMAQEIAAKGQYDPDPTYGVAGDNPIWRWINGGYVANGLTPAQRAARNDLLWNAMPPLNTMHTGSVSGAPGGLTALPDGLTPEQIADQYGTWQLDYAGTPYYYYPYDVPWRIINTKLNLTYTLDDYKAHRPLPDPYPYKDDGAGYYFSTGGSFADSPGSYMFIIAPLMLERMQTQYSGAIFNHDGGLGLPYRYYVTGDHDVGWDASLALVRFALQWPSFEMEVQDVGLNAVDPVLDFNSNWRWEARRIGKIYYDGWSGIYAPGYAQAYDYLFDFINGNQDFASAVHKYVPWINTPGDVITLLDTHILQSTVADASTGRIDLSDPMLFGLIQGPSPVSDRLMDINQSIVDVYPRGSYSLYDHYFNSFSQDGTMFIGSTSYVTGESNIFLTAADSIRRYKDLGGTVPQDLTDLNRFPKIKAFADFLVNFSVAGGYLPSFGDAAGAPYEARQASTFGELSSDARTIWKLTQDPKAAWYIKNVIGGRTTETDSEWSVLEQAAGTVGDPRLTSVSRVFAGLGLGILESGVASSDYRDKRAVVIRTGTGQGHSHWDALDINVFALGLRMANDFGQRNESDLVEYPPDNTSYTHNTVEVDGYKHPWKSDAATGWPGGSFGSADAWVTAFKPTQDAQFIAAEAQSLLHPDVSLFRRDTALIDIDAKNSYVFDVFRVSGGKWHTWCFHGADSGIENGGFTVNMPLSQVSDNPADSTSALYLRKHANGRKFEGTSTDKVEAIWRLSRTSSTTTETNADGSTLDVTTVAAEQSMLGSDYDASSPRKYTRATLFNNPNENVMIANLYSAYYHMNIPILYVQQRQALQAQYSSMAEIDNVYPAIIDTYAGTPLVTSSSSLSITNNDTNARQAVALQVNTSNNRQDFLFSDGNEGALRTVQGGWAVQARFAYYSQDQNGFRKLHLVGGGQLTKDTVSVKPSAAKYTAHIVSVNYQAQQITVDQAWPAGILEGSRFHIYNNNHHTNYKITRVEPQGNGTTLLTFDKPADIGLLGVTSLNGNTITTDANFVLDSVANRNNGLTATNESESKIWKIQKTGSLDCYGSGCSYQLTGQSVALSDFTDVDNDGRECARVYDFGAGDTIESLTDVTFARGQAIGVYLLQADTAVALTLPGSGNIQVSQDGNNWTSITTTQGSSTVTGTIPPSSQQQYVRVASSAIIYGDVSGDGTVSAYDAALCARIAVGTAPLGDKLKVADVSGDGNVSAYDAALIAQYAVGLIGKFPVEG